MSKDEVLKRILPQLQKLSEEEVIKEDDELLDDLGISSMDVLMLLTMFEEEFHTRIPEKRLRNVVTVGDLAEMISDTLNGK